MSFTVYRSSAGSGKTFTLVKEYLKIVLQDTDAFRNILAVTFTNKAAAEMKHRVLGYLEELSDRSVTFNNPISLALIRETGLGEPELRANAEEALKKILHHYSDFAIGTIDSFSHRIIRSFAHDFGLPVNFEVELDSDKLIETAVNLLMDKAGDDEPLTALLVGFLESKMEDDKSWAIDKILIRFSRLLLDEASQQHLPKLRSLAPEDFLAIAIHIRKKIGDFEKSVKDTASAAWNSICEAGLEHQSFPNGKFGISWYFEQIAGGRFDKIIPSAKISGMVSRGIWSGNRATSEEKSAIENIRPLLLESYNKIQSLIGTSYKGYILYTQLRKSIYPLAVLNSIDRVMQEFKKQNNIIHIAEFNTRIASVVLGEPVPFIYERIGERYHHILIDEFQDTSALQWQNFIPLIENSLASGYFNLVVGDGKQAIYRWRNGDVEQFTALPALKGSRGNPVLMEREKALDRNFEEKFLDRNFRSDKEIISFNNDFFSYVSGLLDEPRAKVYAGLNQDTGSAKEGGYIRICFPGRQDDEETPNEAMIGETIRIISECRKDGFAWSDISCLCRRNQDASQLARTLVEKNIPVVSGESLLLRYSAPVRLLISLVNHIHSPGDQLIQAEILNYYCQCDTKAWNLFNEWLGLPSTDGPRTRFCEDFIAGKTGLENPGLLKTLPVFDLFITLVRSFCPVSTNDPYIQFLLNAVLKFSTDKSSSSHDFLDWWDEKKDKQSVIMPAGYDAVQVMTIHKAKGLQFPVVIYPFASEKLDTARSFLWVDLEEGTVPGLTAAILQSTEKMELTSFAGQCQDERQKSMLDLVNVLYVAMTRACNRLYLLCPRPPKSPGPPRSLPSFLKAFLLAKEKWQDDLETYEFGVKNACAGPGNKKITSSEMPRLEFADWRDKIRIRSRAPELWNLDDPEQNRRYGNVLHMALAGINDVSTADDMIHNMLENGQMDKNWEKEILGKVHAILDEPGLSFIFADHGDHKPEAEILTADGHSLRPDRVIIKGQEAIIVDYKTGRPLEKDKMQVRKYAARLKEMGYSPVHGFLLYLEPDIRLEEV